MGRIADFDAQRLYNGKNRTPYVKDAFHDHLIPSHRPKEPEPERSTDAGLPIRSPKTPRTPKLPGLPADAVLMSPKDDDEHLANGVNGVHVNGATEEELEHIIAPPPRPIAPSGGRRFVNPAKTGTKAAAHYHFRDVPGKGGCIVLRLKMTPSSPEEDASILDEELFDDNIEERRVDADEFYGRIARGSISDDLRNIMRQALSGMLW